MNIEPQDDDADRITVLNSQTSRLGNCDDCGEIGILRPHLGHRSGLIVHLCEDTCWERAEAVRLEKHRAEVAAMRAGRRAILFRIVAAAAVLYIAVVSFL